MLKARIRVALLSAAVICIAGCRGEQASVEDLYTTRMLGLSYLQRNQLPQAESAFKKLTKLAPDDPLGYANLGLTHLQAGQYKDAEDDLLQARKLDPRSAEIGLALARLYSLTDRANEARATLEKLRQDSTTNPHVLYALAELESQQRDNGSRQRYEARLRDVLAVAPANLVARLELVDALVSDGAADSAVHQLEEIRRIPPALPQQARAYLDSTIQFLRAGKVGDARPVLDRFLGVVQVTSQYQASMEDIKWTDGPIAGRPVLTFAPKTFITVHGVRDKPTVDMAKFVEVTDESGVGGTATGAGAASVGRGARALAEASATALAVGDVDGDGTDDLFISRDGAARLYRVQGGFVRDATQRAKLPGAAASFATFADFDNDGWLDLFAIGADGHARLFRNRGDGTFDDATAKAGISAARGSTKGIFVDLDHDGDLDLLLTGGTQPIVFRNNLDGTFSDATAGFGITGGPVRDAAYADFDGDGRVDIVLATDAHGLTLLHNGGAQRFSAVLSPSGLPAAGGFGAVAVGDYNNDGFLDIFASASDGGGALWRNKGDGSFSRDERADALAGLRGAAASTAIFVDYDNDGWLDLVVGSAAGDKPGLALLRNDGAGKFLDRSSVLPPSVKASGATRIVATDIDEDGDQDLFLTDAGGAPHLLRNDFGNNNLAVNVELKALRNGSGKNNALGIGARIELRAGNIYQTRVATGRVTHFGLGPHLKADVLRIEWPNGVPQTVYFPGSDQDVVEREMLKGSCALAYTWDGKRFRFVTDAMWRSALGMPLGLMAGTGASAFAPAGASQEYLRIPGDALAPRDGRYLLQLTEELWETAYADQVKLLTVDHPDSIDVFVDERFVPPGEVKLRLYQIAHRDYPRAAVDERGVDVLPALRKSDDIYVSNFTPTRYQGVVEPHDLILDLGDSAGTAGTYLFLRGWIYPTDASINVALAQQSAIEVAPPSLEVRDAAGKWQTAIASIGFPSGKDKTMVIDIAGKFPTRDHHVRIRTNMQIYWDEAFTARDISSRPAKIETLSPMSADLHFRGFSRMYRKGGRYGPYWFAYEAVSKESPWRPITGSFTRFGDVLPLLVGSDDMYVIMGPGDEATLEFDASSARSIASGWKRDFLLYTDGWIKDSDLNTAYGTTVEPLPFHAVRSYPFAHEESYPTDSAHQRYISTYNTRVVRTATERAGGAR